MIPINKKNLIAIYSRKSKYTGKGESIGNQIEMCTNFLISKYGNSIKENIVIYEDEGYTGANTNRPQFQKMLINLKSGQYKMLIVYRLDRISRNVLDFCSLKDNLSNWGVDFISITESFDTSTPMGNAMLMITSVFAQLERDTIAERIKDNMHELAKTGRWLGGNTPLGYISEKIEYISIDGKKHTLCKLSYNDNEIEIIKLIFKKYLELKSLSKLESYLRKKEIKTRNGIYFSRFSLSHILKNIVYCKNDKYIKEFLKINKINVFENGYKFDGKNGMISYNKRRKIKTNDNKIKNYTKDIHKWIISIGKHQGIINGEDWVKVWNLLNKNAHNKRKCRLTTTNSALLSGIIKCSYCGSFMRPRKRESFNKNGKQNFVYMCELKDKSKKADCKCHNINGIEVDKIVIEKIKQLIIPNCYVKEELKKIINKNRFKNFNEIESLESKINRNKNKINSLIEKIILVDNEIVTTLNKKIKAITLENKKIQDKLQKLKSENYNININQMSKNIYNNWFDHFQLMDLDEKRDLINLLINNIETDGNMLIINFIGS